jgi:regulator of protease activity HflC (stomatin/prohibitin superfamily)
VGAGGAHVLRLFGSILSEETNERVVETDWQSLYTKDDVSISFSLAARYCIVDLGQMYVNIHDPEETIKNQLAGCAAEIVGSMDESELESTFADAVRFAAETQLAFWGVDLREVRVLNKIEAQALRLMNES